MDSCFSPSGDSNTELLWLKSLAALGDYMVVCSVLLWCILITHCIIIIIIISQSVILTKFRLTSSLEDFCSSNILHIVLASQILAYYDPGRCVPWINLSFRPGNMRSHGKSALWGLRMPDCRNGGPENGIPMRSHPFYPWLYFLAFRAFCMCIATRITIKLYRTRV